VERSQARRSRRKKDGRVAEDEKIGNTNQSKTK
jgi:hypothetical protein